MTDTLVNIRAYYWHFKLYKDLRFRIESNNFWVHYYSFKGPKPKEPFFAIY